MGDGVGASGWFGGARDAQCSMPLPTPPPLLKLAPTQHQCRFAATPGPVFPPPRPSSHKEPSNPSTEVPVLLHAPGSPKINRLLPVHPRLSLVPGNLVLSSGARPHLAISDTPDVFLWSSQASAQSLPHQRQNLPSLERDHSPPALTGR
jgi:hypothetical protein